MAILNDFTSADEIRATLGVSDEELEDATLSLPLYVRALVFELQDIASDLDTQYITVWSLPASSRTAQQQRLFDTVQLYSAFSVSKQLLTSMPLFAPRSITDGRAEVQRFDDPYADVRAGILEGLYMARRRLVAAYEALTSLPLTTPITAPVLMTATGLAIDPVTGA